MTTIDGLKIGALCPLIWRGELGPHLAQCGLDRGPPPCQLRSSSIQLFDHSGHGPKIGVGSAPSLEGELGRHLTQTCLGRGYLRTKCHLNPASHLATTDMGQKLGRLCPFGRGELGPHLTQCGHGQGLTACKVSSLPMQPFDHSTPTSQAGQTDRRDRQRSDSIGQTVLQLVAQKPRCLL